jgi:hypothetical protein
MNIRSETIESPVRWITGRSLVAVCLFSLPACGSPASQFTLTTTTPEPTLTTDRGALVAGRSVTGGMCVDGGCQQRFRVYRNGEWDYITNGGRSRSGRLTTNELTILQSSVRATRIAAAPAFTGTCPTAFDGSETSYTWVVAGQVHEESTCTKQISPSDPLVTVLGRLMPRT